MYLRLKQKRYQTCGLLAEFLFDYKKLKKKTLTFDAKVLR